MEIHKEKKNWMAAIIMIIIIIILQQNGAHPGKAMAMQCIKTNLFCIQHMHFSYYILRIHISATELTPSLPDTSQLGRHNVMQIPVVKKN